MGRCRRGRCGQNRSKAAGRGLEVGEWGLGWVTLGTEVWVSKGRRQDWGERRRSDSGPDCLASGSDRRSLAL